MNVMMHYAYNAAIHYLDFSSHFRGAQVTIVQPQGDRKFVISPDTPCNLFRTPLANCMATA